MKGGGRKKGREEGEKGRKEGKEEGFHKFHSLNLYACIILKINSKFFFAMWLADLSSLTKNCTWAMAVKAWKHSHWAT